MKYDRREPREPMSVAEIVSATTRGRLPLHITAWDGSSVGPESAPVSLHIAEPGGLAAFVHPHTHLALIASIVAGAVTTDDSPAAVVEAVYQLESLFVRSTPVDAIKLTRTFATLGVKRPRGEFATDGPITGERTIGGTTTAEALVFTPKLSTLIADYERRGERVTDIHYEPDALAIIAEREKTLESEHGTSDRNQLGLRYRLAVLAHRITAGELRAYRIESGIN